MSEDGVEVWRGDRRGMLAGGALATALLSGFPKQAEAKDEILQRLEGNIVPQLPAGMDFANLSLSPALPSRCTALRAKVQKPQNDDIFAHCLLAA
jgi:hypothetical protein